MFEDKDTKAESTKQANSTLLEALIAEVIPAFQKWKEQKSWNAISKAMMNTYIVWKQSYPL